MHACQTKFYFGALLLATCHIHGLIYKACEPCLALATYTGRKRD